MRSAAALALLAACATPPARDCPEPAASAAPATSESAAPVDAARDAVVAAINARDAGALFAMFSAPMQNALPREKTEGFVNGVSAAKGKITAVETLAPGKRKATYRLKAEKGDWQLELTVDDRRMILGMGLTEPPPPDPDVAESPIPLVLPFRERWFVAHGGDTLELNQHLPHKSQRRAADLLIVEDGKSFKTDGRTNEDYHAYGKDVLAIAAGKVIMVIDGVPDNTPGSMNPYFTMGNAITIEHGPALYSTYAHFIPGSMKVKKGDQVKAGQVLGRCGNSGNSSEPHLHVQLQDGPRFEASYGVEMVFSNVHVTRDGKTERVERYTFRKGDHVAP